jgi:hypothetical protein
MAIIDNLAAYYKADESSGDLIDAHSGGLNLTDTNTVGTAAGKVGTARDFEAANSERFTRTDHATFSAGNLTFGFALWLKSETAVANMGILGKTNAADGELEYLLRYTTSGDAIRFYVASGSGFANLTNVAGAPPSGSFQFVCAWHDATADKIFLQIDNGTVNEAAYSAGSWDSGYDFNIGHYFGEYYDGLLDEIAFFKNGFPDSTQRTWLYNSGNGRSYDDIVAEGVVSTPAKLVIKHA